MERFYFRMHFTKFPMSFCVVYEACTQPVYRFMDFIMGQYGSNLEFSDNVQQHRSLIDLFLSAGHDVTPKSCACRLVYWLGYVTAVVVLAAYSATLISFLTIQNKEPPVKTLEALAKDRSYELGMMKKYLRIIRGVRITFRVL